jgi:hypothetical protein
MLVKESSASLYQDKEGMNAIRTCWNLGTFTGIGCGSDALFSVHVERWRRPLNIRTVSLTVTCKPAR